MIGDDHVSDFFSALFSSLDFYEPGRHYPGIEGGPEAGIIMQSAQVLIKKTGKKPNYNCADVKNGECYPHDNK
jgi:hypothetical protein